MRRRMSAIVLMIALLSSGGVLAAADADLSGTWVLASGEAVRQSPGVTREMTLRLRGGSVFVETKITGPKTVQVITDCMTLSGGPTEFTARMADACACQDGQTSSKPAAEGGNLEPGVESAAAETRRWSLSADGKTLTEEVTAGQSKPEGKIRRVYVRR